MDRTASKRCRGLSARSAFILILSLLGIMNAITAAADIAIEPASANSKQVLSNANDSIVQIQALFEGNTEKSSHGSSFVVAAQGLAITNYHVVSDRVLFPDKYQLRYRTAAGLQGAVELVAVDVLHDLALVRLTGLDAPALKMTATLPRGGERAYAIGYPLDVGLTLTEGISNGLVTDSFNDRLHYAGAINGGMSGGPTLDVNGVVIGINVAAYRSQQSVGFLVPARHAIALMARGAQDGPTDFKAQITRQLHQHAARLLTQMPASFPDQGGGDLMLPGKPNSFFECAASGSPALDQPVHHQRRVCSAKSGIYISSALTTGELDFEHNIFSSIKLDALRFANYLQARTFASTDSSFNNWAPDREFRSTACKRQVVSNNGIDLIATICARAYKQFTGLYDLSLRLVSSHSSSRGVTSRLSLSGVPFDPGMAVIERYLKSIRPAGEQS